MAFLARAVAFFGVRRQAVCRATPLYTVREKSGAARWLSPHSKSFFRLHESAMLPRSTIDSSQDINDHT